MLSRPGREEEGEGEDVKIQRKAVVHKEVTVENQGIMHNVLIQP
jgi:hypothetical protein